MSFDICIPPALALAAELALAVPPAIVSKLKSYGLLSC